MKRHLLIALISMLVCATAGVQADEWPAPTVREVFSESREWFVRVVPGRGNIDTSGSAAVTKGPYARAEFYRRQGDRSYRLMSERALVHPVAPVDYVVTDRGYLATLDNWGSVGYGKIAAFYSPRGELIKSYELKDLFTTDEIGRFDRSVSSLWWRKTGIANALHGQRELYLAADDKGTQLFFDIETGAWQLCEMRADQHLCRTTNANRRWANYVEPKSKR